MRKIILALAALGLAAATPAKAASLLEKNFWLSGPNYDAVLPLCDDPAVSDKIASRFARKENNYCGSDLTLQHWAPLHVHIGTLHRVAHVALLEGDTLAAGRTARVQLVFDAPVCALPGDRFIVRNAQATRTVGGGRVLDPFGPPRKRRTAERRAWLDALQAWLDDGRIGPLPAAAPCCRWTATCRRPST